MPENKRAGSAYRKILLGLLLLIVGAIFLHVVGQLALHRGAPSSAITIDVVNRFNLDIEMSVPTWLASFMGIVAGGLASVVGLMQKTKPKKWAWYALGLIMLLVSIDEIAALHELILQALHIKAGFGEVQTLDQNAWLIVLPFVTIAFFLVMIFWYKNLPKKTLVRLVGGLIIYALGAVVIEYAAIEADKGARSYTLGFVVAEEGLEYLGLLAIIRTILLHIREHESDLKQALKTLTGKQ